MAETLETKIDAALDTYDDLETAMERFDRALSALRYELNKAKQEAK